MKKITINDKEYDIACNAYTRFQYKKIFGRGMFEDIRNLNKMNEEQEKLKKTFTGSEEELNQEINNITLANLDDFVDIIERIAYILIYTANDKIGTFENFLKSMDKINLSDSWVSEVTETAVASFLG